MYKCGITGSTGILGKNIIKNINFKFISFKGDITNLNHVEKWIEFNNFDFLIHLAAVVPTHKVKENYKYSKKVNFNGTKNLIDTIIKYKKKPKLIFFSSTSHVYKTSKTFKKLKENDKIFPISLYGKTKFLAENYIKKKLKNQKIKYCIGRIFSFTDKKQEKSFIIPALFNKIRNSKNTIKLTGLNHYRDFLVIEDISRAIEIICKKEVSGVINIGSEKKIFLGDIANYFSKKLKKNIKFSYNKNKTSFLISDNKKLRKTGWKPKKKFFDQLDKF